MGVKVIALDIYGTVLASEDAENILPARKGLEELFDRCESKGIKVVTASDASLINLKIDLKESGVNISKLDNFYELKQFPKDFSGIIEDYGIESGELLVIGDSDKDINGAVNCKAKYFRVPEYVGIGDDFDLNSISFS